MPYVKTYGGHQFATSPDANGYHHCVYGCGCWVNRVCRSSPLGVDSVGNCPKHIIGERFLPDKEEDQLPSTRPMFSILGNLLTRHK